MKPTIPKGTRDFLPGEVVKRKYMFGVIESVFRKYGYLPIETPALENLSTLAGKYGEEGDRLLFKVLNNGDFLQKADQDAIETRNSSKLAPSIARRGLRYDLTVPFARYVVMHRNDLQLPFKRYQIQPVWRADRPQKGRYQEFYQCDVDVVGSHSLVYEAEYVLIYDEVFARFGLPVTIRLNNRKVLAGIAEVAGISDQTTKMTVAIDKWNKIGEDGVRDELDSRGIQSQSIETIISLLASTDLDALAEGLKSSEIGSLGVQELKEVFGYLESVDIKNNCVFDPKLARGLDYYTGCIYEVESSLYDAGSIGGGGRYADLTDIFGMKDLPGVGVSFGAARIYDALEQNDLFPDVLRAAPTLLLLPLDEPSVKHCFQMVGLLRNADISTDMYPEAAKLKKQMKYADSLGAKYVVIVGDSERDSGTYSLKDMASGEQESMDIHGLVERLTH